MDGSAEIQRDVLLTSPRGRPIHVIMMEVCEKYGLSYQEMISSRRSRYVAWPRQEAMYRCAKETTLSLPVIGKHFGMRDRTTIMHGIKAHKRRLQEKETEK